MRVGNTQDDGEAVAVGCAVGLLGEELAEVGGGLVGEGAGVGCGANGDFRRVEFEPVGDGDFVRERQEVAQPLLVIHDEFLEEFPTRTVA